MGVAVIEGSKQSSEEQNLYFIAVYAFLSCVADRPVTRWRDVSSRICDGIFAYTNNEQVHCIGIYV